MPRPPDEILNDFGQGMRGQADVDMFGLLHEVIEDIQSSYRLAMEATRDQPHNVDRIGMDIINEVEGTVSDYVTNHYGEV